MSDIDISIVPKAGMLPSVIAAVKAYALVWFDDMKDAEKIGLATEEAINNVISYSMSSRIESIRITADACDGEFTVCVYDAGLPGDYETILKGEDRLGLTIMNSAVDVVSVENLGLDGRCQRLVKYYSKTTQLDNKKAETPLAPIENAKLTVRTPKKSEMLEICRAFYAEYGLSYINDIIYYPERFYAAVAKDRIHSTVAVDENGGIAGHHAAWQWTDIPGVWESGMAIVNKRYRNAGAFHMMMQRSYNYVHDEAKGKIFLGCCVTTHPYSQKIRLKYGSYPNGFGFNMAPPDAFQSTFRGENEYSSEAFACTVFDKTPRTVYLPEELSEITDMIYRGLDLERTVLKDGIESFSDATKCTHIFSSRTRIGSINIFEYGEDWDKLLSNHVYELKSQGAEMIHLNLSIESPVFLKAYEQAKKDGFFFTALFPCTDCGDVIKMQKMLFRTVNYDSFVTVEPYTTLLGKIRALDPDMKKQIK